MRKPVATRDIERVLEQGGDAPVYGPNLRASCRRMEAAGWLHTLRASNLQLAVGLTDAGRGIAEPLYQEELDAETARQHLTDVQRQQLRQTAAGGIRRIKEGDPLQVAEWYQACFDAGLPVTIQVNESLD